MPRRMDDRARWGKPEHEPLMLKFRVIALRKMRKSEMVRKLREAVRRGVVPEGIEIRWMDWAKGEEGQLREGRIPEKQWTEVAIFYRALVKADIRVERVD
jgi:hypothetical protein